MEFLKEILGEELYSQAEEKVNSYNNEHKDKPIKLANLSEGQYVSKEKFDRKETDYNTLKTQLESANTEIQSYKDMDIEGIKQSATDWEEKYNKLIQDQEEAQKRSIRDERTNAFFNDVKFASNSAKAGIIAEFNKMNFKYDENSKKFLGASEWLEDQKKNDAGAFLSDVANPKFTTNTSTPTSDSSMDSILKAMGLSEEKK